MVKVKWVPSLFVVYISIQVLVRCGVGEEGGTNKPTEKNGGNLSRSSGTRNSAWGGGFVGYGGGNGGCSGGYVYENGRWSCANSDHTGGAGGGYGVSVGVGGGEGGARYGIGDGTGNGNAAGDYGGGSVGGRTGNVGGGSAGVGVGGGEVGVGVGNNGGGGGGNGGGGVGVGIGIGIGVGGGGYSGFVTPGVSGQPFFCTPLSCSNGQCNRLASNLGVEPFQEKETRPSAQENNDQDRSYQNVAPAPASEVDGRSSIGQENINDERA